MSDKEPDVILDTEPDENPNQQVVVDLEKKPVEKQADQPKPVEVKPSQDISKLNNTIAYQTRQLEKAMRELQEMKLQLQSRPQPVQKDVDDPEFDPEINAEAERNWQKGVTKLVEKKISKDIESRVQEAFEKREKAQKEVERKISLESELQKSKTKVISKYPEIEDDQSETAQIYRQVINEDTTILSNIHGPEIAMYRMEERMRQMGKVIPSVKPMIDREVNRVTRAGAGSVIGRQTKNGKITLTKEQEEFCKHYNIPFEQYAKNLKADSADGGVEI